MQEQTFSGKGLGGCLFGFFFPEIPPDDKKIK